MVSRPYRRRAAESERLCEWRNRALPRCQRIERPGSRISWLVGRRGLWRSFRQSSRDADAIKHAELRAETFIEKPPLPDYRSSDTAHYTEPHMLAVHLANKRVSLKNVPKPRTPEGFALIRLLVGGICNTDLELQRGYYGFSGTPGHEFVGEVVEARDPGLVGRRVVGEINLCCGGCDWCRRALGRHCPKRSVLGIVKHPGAFREFLTLPERNLHVVPDSISAEQAVFIEPLAAACEILDQVQMPCGSPVAVLGDGKLGLLIAQVLNAYGFRVHQFGRHRDKLRIAARAGVQTELVRERIPASAYDWVVDATGSPKGLTDAIRMTRPRGTLIMKSTLHGRVGI